MAFVGAMCNDEDMSETFNIYQAKRTVWVIADADSDDATGAYLTLGEAKAAARSTAETTVRYRLTWGDGGERFSSDLDTFLSRYSPEHGDKIHRQTITTVTGDWEEVTA